MLDSDLFLSFFRKIKHYRLYSLVLILFGYLIGSLVSYYDYQSLLSERFDPNIINIDRYRETNFYKNSEAAKGSNPFDVNTTIRRIYEHFPNVNTEEGRDNIFQMWKKLPEDCEEDEFPDDFYKTWKSLNPSSNYTLYTNSQIDQLIKDTFINTVPEIYEAYRLLPKLILQSDFSRYILVFLEGGTYADIDVYPYKPIKSWIDSHFDKFDINVLVSIEYDMNYPNWDTIMPRRLQFLQWTFKSKRRHILFAKLIANIVRVTFQAQLDNHLIAYSDEYINVDPCHSIEIMDWTGPGIFTDSIMEHFNSLKDLEVIDFNMDRDNFGDILYGPELASGDRIDWRLFTGSIAPIIFDDVMVLPSAGFCAFEPCVDLCYVAHYFAGSWKHPD